MPRPLARPCVRSTPRENARAVCVRNDDGVAIGTMAIRIKRDGVIDKSAHQREPVFGGMEEKL